MGKRKRKNQSEEYKAQDYISGYMSKLRLRDLKRACIMRGIPFQRVSRFDVHGLQSWLFKNFDNPINPTLLEKYDDWFDDAIDSGPVPLQLRLSYTGEDDEGNRKQSRRDTLMLGHEKTKHEVAAFRPRRGSMKEMVFQLIRQGETTRDTIEKVCEAYPAANPGSIKSWCSKARKSVKAQEELEDES